MKDLIINHKDIINFWDYSLNSAYDLKNIGIGSHLSYNWKCPVCHYKWKSRVGRVKGCPNCLKKERKLLRAKETGLIFEEKKLMKEWDYDLNNAEGIDPTKISRKSREKANWICIKEKHRWKASIYNRTIHHRNCPYCCNQKILEGYNDLATIDPILASEWNYEKNSIGPNMIGSGTKKKYWWKCCKGHEWEASVSNRYRFKVGCPYCSQSVSFPEKAVYYYLKKYINNVIPNYRSQIINNKEIDVFLVDENIGIEYDGLAFHNKKRDKQKDTICKLKGIELIHISEKKCVDSFQIKGNYYYYDPSNVSELNNIINSILERLLKNGKNFNIDVERDKNNIYKIIEREKKDNALFATNPELIDLWDYNRNDGLNPNMFSKGSKLSVWWKCDKGHEWKAAIYNISKGHRCPICGRKKVWKKRKRKEH